MIAGQGIQIVRLVFAPAANRQPKHDGHRRSEHRSCDHQVLLACAPSTVTHRKAKRVGLQANGRLSAPQFPRNLLDRRGAPKVANTPALA
jgi:hypothetical protein